MSQEPFQTWQSQPWNYESAQQQHRHTLNPTASTTDRAYYWDGSKYVYYQDLQAGLQSRQDQSLLSRSQLPTDMLQSTNGQQMPTYIGNSIQQPNVTPFSQQNLLTHQHQQQWLSQYQYSEQPTQSEHELVQQNSVQDMLRVFPIEPSDYAQSQVCLPLFGLL